MEVFYVYLLRTVADTLYTGMTSDLQRRLREHKAGNGGRYTSARRPVELEYYETASTRSNAMAREKEIKRFTREQKERLIENGPGKRYES
jgi:putative endonuclease